jgi:hypothetical protein
MAIGLGVAAGLALAGIEDVSQPHVWFLALRRLFSQHAIGYPSVTVTVSKSQ